MRRLAEVFIDSFRPHYCLCVAPICAGEDLRSSGAEVVLAAIEFIDPRYADRFKEFPMPHPYLEVVGMIPPELLHSTGKIRIPPL
jgi:hypothetical protein